MMNKRTGRSILVIALIVTLLTGCDSGASDPDTMISSAKEFIGRNDHKAAIIQLKNVLQKVPENGEARYLLGNSELLLGDYASAESELRRAQSLQYSPEQVVPALANAMQHLGEFQKILNEFSNVQLTTPTAKASLNATLGNASLGTNNLEQARKYFDEALALQPDLVEAMLGHARLLAMSDDLNGSLATIDTLLAKSPNFLEAQFFKADVLLGLKRLDEAATQYDMVLAKQPDNVRAHFSKVMLALNQGKLDAASAAVEAMKTVLPQHPQTNYTEAVVAFKKNDLTKARETVQIAVKTAKNYLPALLLAGEIELRFNSLSVAQDYLEKVVAQAPNSGLARRLLIATYLRSGQSTRALETLKPLLATNGDDPANLTVAGEVYLGNNDLAEAEKYFNKAASQNNTYARTRLGQVKFAEGDVQGGLRELESASNMDANDSQADILLVIAHMRNNDSDKALAAIAKLEKKLPNSPIPANLRANALLGKGDVAGARRYLEQALQITPGYFPAALTLARLDARELKWDAAKKRFEDILALDPKNGQALLALSQVRASAGATPAEVEEPITRAITANPSNVAARLAMIRFHLAGKNNDKALYAAQEAQVAVPDNPEVMDALGMTQVTSNQLNDAIITYSKLSVLRPNSPQPQLRLAGIYLRQQQNELAMGALRKALAVKPDLVEAQSGLVALSTLMGRQKDALGIAHDVQRQRPKEAVGYMLEADVYGSEKKWDEAANILRQGIAATRAPNLVVALNTVLTTAGKTTEADKQIADWLTSNPKDAVVRNFLAERSLSAKQYDQATRQYRELLTLEPKNALVYNNLAWIAGQTKNPKAIEWAEEANKLAPNTPAIMDTLGTLLVDKGESQRGIALLKQALALAPNASGIRLNLVRSLAKTGQKDEARKELDTVLKLDDKDPLKVEALALQKTL